MDAGPRRPAPADASARLAAYAAACLGCALVLYAAASHTSIGRRVDESALERQRDSFSPWQVATWVFETVNIVTIAGVVLAIVLVARARGRTRFGVAVAIAVVTAILVSGVAKHGLRRIEVLADDGATFVPSFPSGHATAALAAGLGVALVAGPRSRPAVLALAVIAAASVGVASIVIHAHRPSDVAGGYLVAIGCIAAVLAAQSRLRQVPGAAAPVAPDRPSPLVRALVAAGIALIALGGVAGLLVRGSSEIVDAGLVGAAFAVVGAAMVAAGAFLQVFPSTAAAGGTGGHGAGGHGALEGTGPLAR